MKTTPDAVVSTTPILVIQWALLNERSVRKNDFIKRSVLKTLSPTNGEHIRIEVVATHDFFDIVAPLQIDRKAARHTEVISESSRHEWHSPDVDAEFKWLTFNRRSVGTRISCQP